ncbi:hypothetical protein C8R45DRAFT_933169 [Mycena sanguinolenta]|nr:hypothetical protein C8R45DRAFT_933169 [Mycena sanguinolenta]
MPSIAHLRHLHPRLPCIPVPPQRVSAKPAAPAAPYATTLDLSGLEQLHTLSMETRRPIAPHIQILTRNLVFPPPTHSLALILTVTTNSMLPEIIQLTLADRRLANYPCFASVTVVLLPLDRFGMGPRALELIDVSHEFMHKMPLLMSRLQSRGAFRVLQFASPLPDYRFWCRLIPIFYLDYKRLRCVVSRKGQKFDAKVVFKAKKVTDYVRNIVLGAIRILFISFVAEKKVLRFNSSPISLGKGCKEVMTRTVLLGANVIGHPTPTGLENSGRAGRKLRKMSLSKDSLSQATSTSAYSLRRTCHQAGAGNGDVQHAGHSFEVSSRVSFPSERPVAFASSRVNGPSARCTSSAGSAIVAGPPGSMSSTYTPRADFGKDKPAGRLWFISSVIITIFAILVVFVVIGAVVVIRRRRRRRNRGADPDASRTVSPFVQFPIRTPGIGFSKVRELGARRDQTHAAEAWVGTREAERTNPSCGDGGQAPEVDISNLRTQVVQLEARIREVLTSDTPPGYTVA